MKRITNLAILALLGLSSCTQEFTYDQSSLQNYTFYITDSKINPTESRTKVYLYTYNH